jgi:soluble lytic murein transglycosylase-like protein
VQPAAEVHDCLVSQAFPQAILEWCSLITSAAQKYGVDANLIAAMMLQESGGDPLAYSKSGATGLMQIMPRDGLAAGFQCGNGPCFAGRPTIQELQDPGFNVDYGVRMFAGLVARYGNIREALKAYGGAGYGYFYADKVMAIYQRYGGGN